MKFYKNTDYEISSEGDVYRNGKKLKPYLCKNGYLKVTGSQYGHRVHIWIHKAVGELFVPNQQEGYEILHLNGEKTDNNASNLIWTTRSHICQHMVKILKKNFGESKGSAKLKDVDIKYIRDNYIPRHSEYGVRALSRLFGVTPTAVSLVVRNKSWIHVK